MDKFVICESKVFKVILDKINHGRKIQVFSHTKKNELWISVAFTGTVVGFEVVKVEDNSFTVEK